MTNARNACATQCFTISRIVKLRGIFGATEFRRLFFQVFPWNPNPVISSGRYIVVGNGIVHSNGHRFPAKCRRQIAKREREHAGDDIANIWFDSGANVQGVCQGGASSPLSASTGVGGSVYVRRSPITIWMFLPLVSLCQPSYDSDRTYLSRKGSIIPLLSLSLFFRRRMFAAGSSVSKNRRTLTAFQLEISFSRSLSATSCDFSSRVLLACFGKKETTEVLEIEEHCR